MINFEEYAKWFINVIKCKRCVDYCYCEQHHHGFVCNSIIDGYNQPGHRFPIRPQAGCIDIKWFNKPRSKNEVRILLLGMNPGRGYDKHDALYEIYEKILNQSNIPQMTEEQMNEIGKVVVDYNVFKPIISKIKMISKNNSLFACSNQILCRTDPEASEITKRPGFEKVYKLCFETHTSELIKIIQPDLIIAMGTSWENYFDDNINSVSDKNKYLIVPHPTRPNHRKIAEEKIESFFSENNF